MMTAQVNAVQWQKTLSLDRHQEPPIFQRFFNQSTLLRRQDDIMKPSFLYSRVPQNEPQKIFLRDLSSSTELSKQEDSERNKENQEPKRTRKISFKVKKTPSIYRRPRITSLSANTVAQLTSKFNQMVSEKNSILEEPKFARLIKRVNSQRNEDFKPVIRKPSVKTKPLLKNDEPKRRSSVKRKPSVKKNDEKVCVRAKIGYLESPQTAVPKKVYEAQNFNVVRSPSKRTELPTVSVRAAIEIFERRNSITDAVQVSKPKVPEKNSAIKVKNLVVKNGVRKLKVLPNDSNQKVLPTEQTCEPLTVQTEEIKTEEEEDVVQILNIPMAPPKRCDSMYETLNLKRTFLHPSTLKISKSEEVIPVSKSEESTPDNRQQEATVQPNHSFLWRQKSLERHPEPKNSENDDYIEVKWEDMYDTVDPSAQIPPQIPPRPNSLQKIPPPIPIPQRRILKKKMPLPEETDDKIYEELNNQKDEYSKYEDIEQKSDDGYERFETPDKDDIYETFRLKPASFRRRREEPLPPRPTSRNSYNGENVSNCYESIYNASSKYSRNQDVVSNNYESIYACRNGENWEVLSNRDSLLSADQQSNSLYGRSYLGWGENDGSCYNGKAVSDLSTSDKSDEWVDISDNEVNEVENSFVIIRERPKLKKTAGWSQNIREQWNKSRETNSGGDGDSDHHYESLYIAHKEPPDDSDSFESDTESEGSFSKINQSDSGVDIANSQLPDPPTSQVYGLTKLAASAGKHMKRLRRNWSLTKNDITKSLSRMTKRKSRGDLNSIDDKETKNERPVSLNVDVAHVAQEVTILRPESIPTITSVPYQNMDFANGNEQIYEKPKTNSLSRNKFLNKFRRSSSHLESPESPNSERKAKSTFYLTETINVDETTPNDPLLITDNISPTPSNPRNIKAVVRPQSPPPPVPTDRKRTTSWYAECGLFKNGEIQPIPNLSKRASTCWYAEVGLYNISTSTPSTSSTENSGSAVNVNIKSPSLDTVNQDNCDEYYNLKNDSSYYNNSIGSNCSDTKIDKSLTNISSDTQLHLEDEPLYQFYNAAVLESVCKDGTTDFDYDGYEQVGDKLNYENHSPIRPTAMQLIAPNKNGVTVSRTLWCEIPEVIQSAVLRTLSVHQKKLQEAKFEMITSEASYLNSLNVLTDHFISNFTNCDFLTPEEKDVLFSKVPAVKACSEKLLLDLEKCWQENILLHGVCEVVQKHAEENFYVYVSYCENQILLNSTLKKLKERGNCYELLKQLEGSSACQSLSLYSFLMLPMQRVTRWPLLVDAVLKRLSAQDDEYLACQYALATINKIVTQCNEGARRMERETEMKRLALQIEFSKSVSPIHLVSNSRWLVRSGAVTQLLHRNDDMRLTFGKRFTKVPLYLFLFSDLLLVTKHKGDDFYMVIQYCSRSYIEISNTDTVPTLPVRDTHGRHLIFFTILENHEGKTVEMLLSCNSESDKERWMEALSPPKSEDPNETVYGCWDCPQVTAIHNYNASQPDELPVSRGDIINVTRKMADGWYHGERIRDGQVGWFPANYSVEVANPHVRARNLKQRYRLLAFSENYLKSQ